MSLPYTHNETALSLINEAIEVQQALEAAGLPGVLPSRTSKNHVDKDGPAWARMACTWALMGVSPEGMFHFTLRDRPRSRLFNSRDSTPRELRLTAVELATSFPDLCAEVARYQRGADVLDEVGAPLGGSERALVQVQRLAQRLVDRLQRAALTNETWQEGALVRVRQGGDEDRLRATLDWVPDWLKLPPELPAHVGMALSSGRMEGEIRRMGRDRLLYLPTLPLPEGRREFGALELVVLANGSDAAESRFDVAGYVRDEFKETARAAASAAVSWSDLERALREGLDAFTAATRTILERRLSAACLLLREPETGRCLCATLGNITLQRYDRAQQVLQPVNYAQTISGLSLLARDLGLTEPDVRRFVYLLVTGRVTSEDVADTSDARVEAFWDDFAQRNTEALRPDSARTAARQMHHIALAGVGGNRADYEAAWSMTRQLVDAFATSGRYPRGLSAGPLQRLSRSFMDVVAFQQAPAERLLMGSGAFNQLMDLLTMVHMGLAALPLAKKTLDRAAPMRCAEWMHMLHLQLPSREDMAAVVLDHPEGALPLRRPPPDTLFRGTSPRDGDVIYQRHRLALTDPQPAELLAGGPFVLAPPDAGGPIGVRLDLDRLRLLQSQAASPSRWRWGSAGAASPAPNIEEATFLQEHADSLLGRSMGHRLSFSSPLAAAGKLAHHLQRLLQPSSELRVSWDQALPLEGLLSVGRQPGEVDPFTAQALLWAVLRINLPPDWSLALRWVRRGASAPLPVVELSRGSHGEDAQVLSLLEAQPVQPAAAFYRTAEEILPTDIFARVGRRDAAPLDAHRERQRRQMLDLADRTASSSTALAATGGGRGSAADSDQARYLPVRVDKRGRLQLGAGRSLPNTAATPTNAQRLLANPSPGSEPSDNS